MSDWSRVIVCWTSFDALGLGRRTLEQQDAAHRRRAREIETLVNADCSCSMEGFVVGEGRACESVAIYSCNYFDAEHMAAVLTSMHWDRPEQVEFFHKSEEADTYTAVQPFLEGGFL